MGRKIGIFGGSFDPIHHAHVQAGEAARDQLGLDLVLFVVANQPWQKTDLREVTEAAIRLHMVNLALKNHPGLESSSLELDRGGLSYTIDTIDELDAVEFGAELWLLVGSDVAANLNSWNKHEEIARRVKLGVFARPDYEFVLPSGWDMTVVMMDLTPISSSGIREQLMSEEEPVGLDEAVLEFIRDQDLYRENRP